MFHVNRGKYGYLTRRKHQLIFRCAVIAAGIVILMALGIYSTGTRQNLLSIVAVVSALPFANQMVVLIATMKFHSRPREEYEQVVSIVGNGLLDVELIVTSQTSRAMQIDYAYIHEKGIFCWSADPKLDPGKTQKYLKDYMQANDLKTEVFVIRAWKHFLRRLSELEPEDRNTVPEDLLRMEGVLRNLAL